MHIRVNNVRLFFDVEGVKLRPDGPLMREAPTLLLLHGGPGSDHSGFKPFFSRAAEYAQVVYLDLRGNGRSEAGSPEQWSLQQWADDVRAFCEALSVDAPIVLGHSFGGIVAMVYATRFPDHPSKLVLSSTSTQPVGERSFAVFERLGGARARAAAIAFWQHPDAESAAAYDELCIPSYTRTPPPPGYFERAIRNPAMRLFFIERELQELDLLGRLDRIKCPTLLVAGEDDPITPLADMEEIAAALPPHVVRFERFAHAGHGVFRDQPDRFFLCLRKFIEKSQKLAVG